jgi:hypothetical protein
MEASTSTATDRCNISTDTTTFQTPLLRSKSLQVPAEGRLGVAPGRRTLEKGEAPP